MGKRIGQRDGISIEQEGFECEGQAKRQSRFFVLPLVVLLLFSSLLTVQCLVTILDIEIKGWNLFLASFIGAVVWSALHLLPNVGKLALLPIYLGWLCIFLWRRLEQVGYGFIYIENAAITLINSYYDMSIRYYITEYEQAETVTLFFAVIVQLLLAVYAETLFAGRLRLVTLLIMGSAAFCGLFVGVVPQDNMFLGQIACMMAVLAIQHSGFYDREGAKEYLAGRARNTVMAAALFTVLCLVVSFIISTEFYLNNIRKPERKAKLAQTIKEVANSPVWNNLTDFVESLGKKEKNNTASKKADFIGGLNSGHFSRADRITFENETALIVTMPEVKAPVYLKGYNGAVYTASGWEDLDSQDENTYKELLYSQFGHLAHEQIYHVMNQLFEEEKGIFSSLLKLGSFTLCRGTMEVHYNKANTRYIYGPYSYQISQFKNKNEINYIGDSYIAPKRSQKDYTFEFCMWDNLNKEQTEILAENMDKLFENKTYSEFESKYREFVHRVYTVLPNGSNKAELLGLSADEDAAVWEKIEAVQEYLSGYEYSLAPGAMPEKADFVDYFLFENKKGYCVHFASAAVLLLRSLGVPARYAEGYLITEGDIKNAQKAGVTNLFFRTAEVFDDDFSVWDTSAAWYNDTVTRKRIEIKDYNAHAWVEVYFDKIGWVPVEMTVGFTGDGVSQLPDEIMEEVERVEEEQQVPTPFPTLTSVPEPEVPTPTEMVRFPDLEPKPTKMAAPVKTSELTGTTLKIKGDGFRGWWRDLPKTARIVFSFGIVFFLFLFFAFARYRVVWYFRERKSTRRGQAVELYRRMERLLLHEKGSAKQFIKDRSEDYETFADRVAKDSAIADKNFGQCQEVALRAAFGQDAVLDEDLILLDTYYQRMKKSLYAQYNLPRRIYLEFWKIC